MNSARKSCSNCLDLDIKQIRDLSRSNIHSCTLEAVSHSSETCAGCNVLCRAVRHCYPETFEAADFFNLKFLSFGGEFYQNPHKILGLGLSPMLTVDTDLDDENDPLRDVEEGWDQKTIHIYSGKDKPCPWPLIGVGADITSNHGELAEQVKLWLNECETSHTACKTIDQGILPKRVLQILPGPTSTGCKVRLYEPSSAIRAKYVCLSHCWGKHQIIVTTQSNIKDHNEDVPWHKLSKTFQDAVRFTHALGLEYIWIDSLCIIQNSNSDWEEEAKKMAAYYTNAYVTLAASAATDGTVGFFPKREAKDEVADIQGVDADGKPYHVMVRKAIQHPFDNDEYGYHRFPLMSRGWVHQEHVLSHRFVHFGARELLWECHSATKCQCGMIPVNARSDWNTNQLLSVVKGGIDAQDMNTVRELWYDNVEAIMNLDFTFVKDRLPAAAGVATALAKGFKGRYLAGLWEDTLIHDLCWAIHESGQRPDELRKIPSWSWGSVTGGLATLWCRSDLTNPNVAPAARVVNIDCGPEPSILGDVGPGIITLEGLGASVVFTSKRVGVHVVPILRFGKDAEHEATFRNWHFHVDVQDWHDEDAEFEILLLKLMAETVDGHTKSAVFLVLQLSSRDALYKRVGLLRAQVRAKQKLVGAEVLLLDQFRKAATKMTVSIG